MGEVDCSLRNKLKFLHGESTHLLFVQQNINMKQSYLEGHWIIWSERHGSTFGSKLAYTTLQIQCAETEYLFQKGDQESLRFPVLMIIKRLAILIT